MNPPPFPPSVHNVTKARPISSVIYQTPNRMPCRELRDFQHKGRLVSKLRLNGLMMDVALRGNAGTKTSTRAWEVRGSGMVVIVVTDTIRGERRARGVGNIQSRRILLQF